MVGSGVLSCPKREALGTGELGKECLLGGNLMDRRIFFGLPVKLGQLCSHSGSLGGNCALLALCLGKEKASPL